MLRFKVEGIVIAPMTYQSMSCDRTIEENSSVMVEFLISWSLWQWVCGDNNTNSVAIGVKNWGPQIIEKLFQED